MLLSKTFLLLRTVRHLKPIQLYWRISQKCAKKCPDQKSNNIQQKKLELVDVIKRPVSFSVTEFRFLNHSSLTQQSINWNDPSKAKLWLYNLHYFDYLLQPELDPDLGLELMVKWVNDNPACQGNGWEPYPLSLRIVNWSKFLQQVSLQAAEPKEVIIESLHFQCRSLRNQLEYHLLGNHLFKNAVALLFGGRNFKGIEAEEWYEKGRSILLEQLDEQVLDDGGHFERSPMYHALILEDILDCINVIRSEGGFKDPELEGILLCKATSMLSFLADTHHPDGSLPFFNDTAQGISSSVENIFAYSTRLNLGWTHSSDSLIKKTDFGLYVFKSSQWHVTIDAGKIGPDYLPGHAHCDTLSYELALDGKLIIVNAGVFQYAGEERNIYRATRSHNTVEIDNEEQHEIWSTFRVARRGYPQNIAVEVNDATMSFSGQHTGYQRLKGKPVHQRDLNVTERCIKIIDRVIGKGEHSARSFIHFHPTVSVTKKSVNKIALSFDGQELLLTLEIESEECKAKFSVEDYYYSREFGLKEVARVVVIHAQGHDDFSISYSIIK